MEVLRLGNAILQQKSESITKVTDEIRCLVSEMFEVMVAANGLGLAAPQVGKLLRLFIIIANDSVRRVFINPQITATSETLVECEEGCLSIPGIFNIVSRPAKVTVQALDENGKFFTLDAEGTLARAIQHENDHLDGILYIDRLDAESRKKTIEQFNLREARRNEKRIAKAAKSARINAKHARKEQATC